MKTLVISLFFFSSFSLLAKNRDQLIKDFNGALSGTLSQIEALGKRLKSNPKAQKALKSVKDEIKSVKKEFSLVIKKATPEQVKGHEQLKKLNEKWKNLAQTRLQTKQAQSQFQQLISGKELFKKDFVKKAIEFDKKTFNSESIIQQSVPILLSLYHSGKDKVTQNKFVKTFTEQSIALGYKILSKKERKQAMQEYKTFSSKQRKFSKKLTELSLRPFKLMNKAQDWLKEMMTK